MRPLHAPMRHVLIASLIWGLAWPLVNGCKSDSKGDDSTTEPSDEAVEVGPEGAVLNQAGAILLIPAGALTKKTKIKISASDKDLSAGAYVQEGVAWSITPADIELRLPAVFTPTLEEETGTRAADDDDDSDEFHGLLLRASELRQLSAGASIHLLRLGEVAKVKGPKPEIELVGPMLSEQPGSSEQPLQDAVAFELAVPSAATVDWMAQALDYDDLYPQELNGATSGACGFRLEDVQGGSLRTGCTPGLQTASIEVHQSNLTFNLVPFQLPTLTSPVLVHVLATIGDTPAIWFDFGFFRYATGPCWGEFCSGHGTCIEDEASAQCMCDPGFVPDGLTCVCQPQCTGRTCGPDGCGGRCQPGCAAEEVCDQANGTCVSTDSTDETSTTTTSDTTSDTTGETSTDTTATPSTESESATETTDETSDVPTTDDTTTSTATDETTQDSTSDPTGTT